MDRLGDWISWIWGRLPRAFVVVVVVEDVWFLKWRWHLEICKEQIVCDICWNFWRGIKKLHRLKVRIIFARPNNWLYCRMNALPLAATKLVLKHSEYWGKRLFVTPFNIFAVVVRIKAPLDRPFKFEQFEKTWWQKLWNLQLFWFPKKREECQLLMRGLVFLLYLIWIAGFWLFVYWQL